MNSPLSFISIYLLSSDVNCDLEVLITPESREIEINDKGEFIISLDNSGIEPGIYNIKFRFSAAGIYLLQECVLTIDVKEDEIELKEFKVSPQFEILFATAFEPDFITINPGKTKTFKVFIRNADKIFLHNISLSFHQNPFEYVESPKFINQLAPNEIRYFSVNMSVPKDYSGKDMTLRMELQAKEFQVPFKKELLVRVVSNKYLLYIYSLIIALVIIILVIRTFKKH
jgi:uncharacterized membrane protein